MTENRQGLVTFLHVWRSLLCIRAFPRNVFFACPFISFITIIIIALMLLSFLILHVHTLHTETLLDQVLKLDVVVS